MNPRFGEPRRCGKRYRRRPGAYGILLRGGELLVTWQGGEHQEFQLPGGGIDPGESPITALHREVREETGWRISAPRRLGAWRRYTYMPEYDLWAEKICHVFLARAARRLGPPTEPEHEAIWLAPKTGLALLANGGDRVFVAQAMEAWPVLFRPPRRK